MEKLKNNIEVVVLSLSDPFRDPRPMRMIELCGSLGMNVSICGFFEKASLAENSSYAITPPPMSIAGKIMRKFYGFLAAFSPSEWLVEFVETRRFGLGCVKEQLAKKKIDLFVVEDLHLLPLVFKLKRGVGKILFDAREYYPRQNEGNLWFDWVEKKRRTELCRRYLPMCDGVMTVSNGLAREYEREFGIIPAVVRSVPRYVGGAPRQVDPKRIRMVYHGAASRNRKLENLIHIFNRLDERFDFDMILVGNSKYQQELKKMSLGNNRIRFPAPVPFEKIIPTLKEYDIGFFYYEPTGFNIANCLPNKFFEYIQARLMLAIGPSPDMAELVRKYGCGVVAEEFTIESMTKKLLALTVQDINEAKKKSDRAARELCFERENKKIVRIMSEMIE